jgi:arginine exporter protein ArgO
MALQAEHDFWGTLSVVMLAIVGVATLAVLVSRNSTTAQLITATGSAFSNSLGVALSPVTGGGSSTFPIG